MEKQKKKQEIERERKRERERERESRSGRNHQLRRIDSHKTTEMFKSQPGLSPKGQYQTEEIIYKKIKSNASFLREKRWKDWRSLSPPRARPCGLRRKLAMFKCYDGNDNQMKATLFFILYFFLFFNLCFTLCVCPVEFFKESEAGETRNQSKALDPAVFVENPIRGTFFK